VRREIRATEPALPSFTVATLEAHREGSLAGAAALLLTAAMFAAWIPARRAGRIEPMAAVRVE
jgi:ABC-type lipoprotein release transport system permease subunit